MDANSSSNNPFYVTVYFTAVGGHLQVAQYSDPQGRESQVTIPRPVELSVPEMEGYLKDGPLQLDLRNGSSIPPPLSAYPRQLACETAAYVPILDEGQLR